MPQELLNSEAIYIDRKTDLFKAVIFFTSHDYLIMDNRVKNVVGIKTRLHDSMLIVGMLLKRSADQAMPSRLEGFYSATG